MEFTRHPGLAALLAAFCTLGACGGSDDPPPTTRTTSFGVVEGADDSGKSGTYAWKGVPFAKAPTGALRWKAPVDPDAWASPRATRQFSNACVQYGRIYGPGANNMYDATITHWVEQGRGNQVALTWEDESGAVVLPATPSFLPAPRESTPERTSRASISRSGSYRRKIRSPPAR